MNPTMDELIQALDALRMELVYRECTNDRVAAAIATLDNGGVFRTIDEASDYDI